MRKNIGFTLIELSIVLVIIALIVSGILVGRDMIANAQTRKLLTQFEQIETTAIPSKANITASREIVFGPVR